MPPKKNKPKITPGQLRGIIRDISQPPNNARQRKVPPQTKLVTRKRGENPPRSGKVKRTQTGIKKTPATIATERYQATQVRLQRLAQRLQQPAKRAKSPSKPRPITVSRRIPMKADVEGTGKRAVKYRGKVIYLTPGQIKGLVGKGDVVPDSPRNTVDILKRELNLTPGARARLDAEEARLAREEQLSRNKQYEESKRNRRVQNPLREPAARREAERRVIEGLRAIERAERAKERLTGRKKKQRLLQETSDAIDKRSRRKIKEARQTRPSAPRGGIVPGAGGGLLPRIR